MQSVPLSARTVPALPRARPQEAKPKAVESRWLPPRIDISLVLLLIFLLLVPGAFAYWYANRPSAPAPPIPERSPVLTQVPPVAAVPEPASPSPPKPAVIEPIDPVNLPAAEQQTDLPSAPLPAPEALVPASVEAPTAPEPAATAPWSGAPRREARAPAASQTPRASTLRPRARESPQTSRVDGPGR